MIIKDPSTLFINTNYYTVFCSGTNGTIVYSYLVRLKYPYMGLFQFPRPLNRIHLIILTMLDWLNVLLFAIQCFLISPF
jgi:hypothetical protein